MNASRAYVPVTPEERAETLEREAETSGDRGTWAIAQDAWEEAGDPKRAWYAFTRSQGLNGDIMRRTDAAQLEHVLSVNYPLDAPSEDYRNRLRSRLELFRFVTAQPDQLLAYYMLGNDNDDDDLIVSFVGDLLGHIVHRGKTFRPFGSGGLIQAVTVQARNGYLYHGDAKAFVQDSGTCALENGTYCRLRRGKPWLRQGGTSYPRRRQKRGGSLP